MTTSRTEIAPQPEQKRNKPTRALRAVKVAMCAIIAILACATHARAIDTYNYRGVCPYPNGGKKIHDKWNFWECECTSYVADKLNERGVPFWWEYKNVDWNSA